MKLEYGLRYFSMFRGISGFELGLERAYMRYFDRKRKSDRNQRAPVCVGYSEIDKYACAVTRYRYPEHKNYGDAFKLNPKEIETFDLLCAGFPCQAFSITGHRRGFADIRGTLFFEIKRILENKRPSHFLLENVEGLRSHENGKTIQTILEVLAELGYFVEVALLNTKHHGLPQNRPRIFFVGHLADRCGREILPFRSENEIAAEARAKASGKIKTFHLDGSFPEMPYRVGTIRTYNVRGGFAENVDGACPTLTTQGHQGAFNGKRLRHLTPVECERFQGFPDDWTRWGIFEDGEAVREISDRQRYKMSGNAVSVNMIDALFFRMIEKGCLFRYYNS